MIDDTKLTSAINGSPLALNDKKHWLGILGRLNQSQKERLYHSLMAKTDIAAAKGAIGKALKIIDDAEKEAEEDIKKEDAARKAKEELMKEIDAKNPMMPDTDEEPTKEKLEKTHQAAEDKLAALRQELSQLSHEATGTTPPSQTQSPQNTTPGSQMPQG